MKPRTFCVLFEKSFADPRYTTPVVEYNPSRVGLPEGVTPSMKRWGGWKGHLISWFIKRFLLYPDFVYEQVFQTDHLPEGSH
jgi:hypothetical protein